MAKTLIERADLFFTEGGSDKEYHAQLFEVEGSFTVEFQYGRRGSTLTSGTKTATPVDQAVAKKAFDKLVKEKTAKGYTPDVSGEVFVGGDNEARVTGILPQLLNPITDSEFNEILANIGRPGPWNSWVMQQKHDGDRRGMKGGSSIEDVLGSNRKGLSVGLPQTLADALVGRGIVLDGEIMGTRYVAFDLLEADGADLRLLPYKERLARLEALGLPPEIEIVKTFYGADCADAVKSLRKLLAEGVVFKELLARHNVGRPASGGAALKYKFYATATVLVTGSHPSKRSVSLALLDTDGNQIAVGNVTVPANLDIPKTGELWEVRYLYAYQGGSLYQPNLLKKRTDLDRSAATMAQLKYKAGTTTEDEDEDPAT